VEHGVDAIDFEKHRRTSEVNVLYEMYVCTYMYLLTFDLISKGIADISQVDG
jgi:hypothetical protein